MHPLPIPDILIQLAEYEKYVQEQCLRPRFTEVEIVRHAALHVLENLIPEDFILTEDIPRGLSRLSKRSDCTLSQLGSEVIPDDTAEQRLQLTSSSTVSGSPTDSRSCGCSMLWRKRSRRAEYALLESESLFGHVV